MEPLNLQDRDSRADFFLKIPQLAYFSLAERESLAQLATVRTVRRGLDVYVDGSPADSFAILASGQVNKKSTTGRKPLAAPALLGTLPLLRRNLRLRRRTAGLVAVTDATLIDVPYRALDGLSPERHDAFVDTIAEEALLLIERLDHPGQG